MLQRYLLIPGKQANSGNSIVFLHRDRFLSNLKPHSDVFHDMTGDDQYQPDTIQQLFEAAQRISSILSALEASEASVMTPYSGFSVFVAAHINMYGTLVPQRYPGGLDRAEDEKSHNMMYLERLSTLWPVGRSWVRTDLTTPCTCTDKLILHSGELYKMRTDSTRQSRAHRHTQNLVCTVQGGLHWQEPWTNTVTSVHVQIASYTQRDQ
jgi:hypothetical protein